MDREESLDRPADDLGDVPPGGRVAACKQNFQDMGAAIVDEVLICESGNGGRLPLLERKSRVAESEEAAKAGGYVAELCVLIIVCKHVEQ